jgi:hypothetical protein
MSSCQPREILSAAKNPRLCEKFFGFGLSSHFSTLTFTVLSAFHIVSLVAYTKITVFKNYLLPRLSMVKLIHQSENGSRETCPSPGVFREDAPAAESAPTSKECRYPSPACTGRYATCRVPKVYVLTTLRSQERIRPVIVCRPALCWRCGNRVEPRRVHMPFRPL